MPVDVVKTRLQLDGAGSTRLYSGSVDCARKLLRAEGARALFKGLSPALLRQSTYGSIRYGLYVPLRDALGADAGVGAGAGGQLALGKKVVAGAAAGALASGIANPTDLVKVRMQTAGMLKEGKYRGVAHCFRQIVRDEGVVGLWTGVGPTMGRATALAAAELTTYDEVKLRLRLSGTLQDGLPLHVSASFFSGFAATLASSPFDVVKSRVMGQPVDASGRGLLYRGTLDCLAQLIQNEGARSLYRGFWPNFGRIVPRVTIIFVALEQLKAKFG